MNLVANAKHALADRGRPWIRLETVNDGDRLVLRVVDNGSGIPASMQSRIFDAFYTTKPVGEGTGMGLSLRATGGHAFGR